MRISELATASGVSVATLKFYLREGLVPAGDARGVHQAVYGTAHVRRVRLIRALTEIGGLRLREVRAVLHAIEDEQMPIHELLGVAQYALEPVADRSAKTTAQAGAADVDAVLRALGWTVDARAPARQTLARALVSLRELGWDVALEDVARYGRAVDGLAAGEVAALPTSGSRAETVERLVVGTVLFEAVLDALRRLAQEHHSSVRFGSG